MYCLSINILLKLFELILLMLFMKFVDYLMDERLLLNFVINLDFL